MTEANRRANIAEELAKAERELAAAEVLRRADILEPAETRIYYALFHVAVAMLLTKGLEPRSHRGLGGLLGLHFVKAGLLDARWSRTLTEAQAAREGADYERGWLTTADAVDRGLDSVREFLGEGRRIVAAAGLD